MTPQTKENKTADEILDEELSANMIEHIEKIPQLKEWIKDAMYSFAQQNAQSTPTKELMTKMLESQLAIEKARYELRILKHSGQSYKEYPIGTLNVIQEIERQLNELRNGK